MQSATNNTEPALPHLSFVARLSLAFIVLFVILTAIAVRVWQTTERFEQQAGWVTHALEVENRAEAVLSSLGAIQADATVYVATGAMPRAVEFESLLPRLDRDLLVLQKLTADNPEQSSRVHELTVAVQARRDLLSKAVAARQTGNAMPNLPTTGAVSARRIADAIITVEAQVLEQRRDELGATASITRMLTTSAIALSIIFLVLAFWLILRTHMRQLEQQRTLRDANVQLQDTLAESWRLSESMQRLAGFGEMLQSCRDMNEIRQGVQEALGELLPGLGGRLALLNPSQNLLAIGAHWGTHGLIAESVFSPEDCWALRRGQAYPLSGTSSGFVCKHVHWPNPDFPESTYFCVPLTAQGEVIGVLTIDGMRTIDPLERRLGIAASEQLALSLANIRLQDTLRTQSIRDPLTGLFNRRYLEVSFERELLRATRRTLPLSVLMLDLDHFKRFNDSHGHEAGDALLAQFAEVLKRATRNEDIACRYGGEEFTVVLHEAGEDIARERAELIRSMTAEMSVAHRQVQLEHITVSIGYAVFPRDGTTAENLLRRADAALYAAKRSGRNRVASALENPVQPAT